MEEKENTVSESPRNSENDSPPLPVITSNNMVPPVLVAMDGDKSFETTLKTTTMSITGSGSGDFLGKKKRGRPRKYDSDGNLRVGYTNNNQGLTITPSPPGFSLSPSSPSSSQFSSKRRRGKHSGSGHWQILACLGELFTSTAGGDFTPHVLTVGAGEDVAGKILSFCQKGPRGICVLSANGAVSNVTLRQPGSSGGILTYEGRFEILSLSGSYTVIENGGMRSRTGGLSVSLAGPDGRVIGGGVAGLLMAANPIQVVVGSFMPNAYKTHKRKHQHEHPISSSQFTGAPDTITAARPISQAKPLTTETPLTTTPSNGESDHCTNDIIIHNLNAPTHDVTWNGPEPSSDHGPSGPSPDINVSVSCGE